VLCVLSRSTGARFLPFGTFGERFPRPECGRYSFVSADPTSEGFDSLVGNLSAHS
jgi:hypothetical protein